MYFRLRYFGEEHIPKQGGFIIASNHQSYMDPVFVGTGTRRPLHFMTRSSAFRIPVVGPMIQRLNAFPVDRGQTDFRAIRRAMEILAAGGGLLVFPEGTRSRDGSLGRMKSGVISIGQRAECPIVPAAIRGAFEVWPRHRLFPRMGRVSVAFGPPIPPGWAREKAPEIAGRLQKSIVRLYEGLEWRHPA
ncbi:MAG: 1-acyl-sn-glycerol-3-phosphate acyltransferase [Planctomycetes bacterium]|nr:1-acyl-sn-glycerol-3-phosphate acyltransferase [Planctomycetota bacterium]